jgi:hypothetical protein
VRTLNRLELKEKLEKTLHTRISGAEWLALREGDAFSEHQRGDLAWPDLRDIAEEELRRLRRFLQNVGREGAGELRADEAESSPVGDQEGEEISSPFDEGILSKRTVAHARALNALDQLRRGPKAWDSVTRYITSRVEPIGRGDGTLPQWVIQLEIEAWVPEEDVLRIYQDVRRKLLADHAPPKVQPRTYEVARFVWQQELVYGKRPSWPELCDRWNQRNPEQEHFKDWRAFHTCFQRGEKATPPRYVNGDDHIIGEARRLKESRDNPPSIGLQPPSPLN